MDPAHEFPEDPIDAETATPQRPEIRHQFCLLGQTGKARIFDRKPTKVASTAYPFVRFTRYEIQIGCSTIEIEAAKYLLEEHSKWLKSIDNAEKIL